MKEFLSNAVQEIKPKRETNLVWFGIYYKEHAFWARESQKSVAQYQIKTWTYVIDSVSNTKSTGNVWIEDSWVGSLTPLYNSIY